MYIISSLPRFVAYFILSQLLINYKEFVRLHRMVLSYSHVLSSEVKFSASKVFLHMKSQQSRIIILYGNSYSYLFSFSLRCMMYMIVSKMFLLILSILYLPYKSWISPLKFELVVWLIHIKNDLVTSLIYTIFCSSEEMT